MKRFRLKLIGFLMIMGLISSGNAFAESYFQNIGRNSVRGFKNVIGCPLEIPITMQKFHEQAGLPIVRQTEGFFEGTFRMIQRAGSGLWDWGVMLIPSDQDGVPVEPETLF